MTAPKVVIVAVSGGCYSSNTTPLVPLVSTGGPEGGGEGQSPVAFDSLDDKFSFRLFSAGAVPYFVD